MISGGFFGKIGNYFKDVQVELKKVTWPSLSEVVKLTAIVIAFTFIVALLLGGLDFIIVALFKLFLLK